MKPPAFFIEVSDAVRSSVDEALGSLEGYFQALKLNMKTASVSVYGQAVAFVLPLKLTYFKPLQQSQVRLSSCRYISKSISYIKQA
jgi:hypothetical protein